jgi:hypothetical protein
LNCFKYGEYSRDISPKDAKNVKNKLGFFPVDKLIIQGKQKDDKIEIEGNDALDIFRALLEAYYDAYLDEDDDRIKQFSDDLFRSHSLFKANLVLATCPPGTYGSKFKKYNEKEKIEDKLQMQRQMLALNIHRFIKTYSTNGDKKISNWHKKLIGELLIFSGIAQNESPNVAGYIEPPYYNNIANWIERG